MKKFIEFFKNARNIIKILTMISEMLTAVAEIYNKYYPDNNKEEKNNDSNRN